MYMMTSANGNIFRVTGHLCGEFTSEFPAQKPVMQSFDVFFDLRLTKRLSKQWWGWSFAMPLCPLWRHCNDLQQTPHNCEVKISAVSLDIIVYVHNLCSLAIVVHMEYLFILDHAPDLIIKYLFTINLCFFGDA